MNVTGLDNLFAMHRANFITPLILGERNGMVIYKQNVDCLRSLNSHKNLIFNKNYSTGKDMFDEVLGVKYKFLLKIKFL